MLRSSPPGAVLFGTVFLLLVGAAGADDRAEDAVQTVRLRLEWGGGEPHLWTGLLELSRGRFEETSPLAVEADEPGTLWIDGREANAVWIQRRSPRMYDGFDITVRAPPSAVLSMTLQSTGQGPIRERLEARLGELSAGTRGVALGDGGARLVVRRAPGDLLAFRTPRPHLVFQPGERLVGTVRADVPAAQRKAGGAVLEWQVGPARSKSVLTARSRHVALPPNESGPVTLPVDVSLPADEGVYDVRLALIGRGMPRLQSVVQVVVVSQARRPPGDSRDEAEGTLLAKAPIDSFRPADAGYFRRIERRTTMKLVSDSVGRLWGGGSASMTEEIPEQGPKVQWNAWRLRLRNTGRPHLLVVTVPADVPQTLGVSVLEPNAAGQLMPAGIDSGLTVRPRLPAQAGAKSSEPTVRHEVLFWPKVRDPIVLLHDVGSGKTVRAETVEVHEIERLERPATVPQATGEGPPRLVGPYLHKPLLAGNFGATEMYDPDARRSLNDWVTFHTAGVHLTEYLEHAGYNSLLLAVLADGSTLYPSRLVQPTPRYDSGAYFSSGQDPFRKDVLELLYRMFERAGLVLIPELQFSTPLPALERQLAVGGDGARGIELIGRDGRSWREARSSSRGLAPYYNPLDSRVQEAILDVVRELVERYQHHRAFQGVAVELSSAGYLHFPGLDWGYDDDTIARFSRATGVQVPAAEGNERYQRRYEFLSGEARTRWIRWRCEELARFHGRLAECVTADRPSARLILSAKRVLRGGNPDESVYDTLKGGGNLEALLPTKGLDFSLYADIESLTLLRPTLWGSPDRLLGDALDETLNAHPNLDAAFAARQRGSLFYHLPRECRLADFDDVSPWQPAYTWLATQTFPAGSENRKRYVRALAALDAQVIFDGGWMAPLGQERETRQVRDVIRALPAVDFRLSDVQRQPAVVRIARHGDRTYLYVVNDSPGRCEIALHLTAPPETACRVLGRRAEARLKRHEPDGSLLTLSLDAYDVWACDLSDPACRIVEVEARPARDTLTAMEEHIRQFDRRLTEGHQKTKAVPAELANPGFEQARPARGTLPGWDAPPPGTGVWTLDSRQPQSGQACLMLTAGHQQVTAVSTGLPLRDSRLVTVSLWLRSDREPTDVRLAFDARIDGQSRVQHVAVQVDRGWKRYLFRVTDIPAGRLEDARLRIELRGSGKVWLDDVEVEMYHLTADDLRQLTKVFSAVTLAWEEKRYSDCQRLLESYWGRFLFDGDPQPATPPEPLREAGRWPSLWRR